MEDVHCLGDARPATANPLRDENINISDVIEVLEETDPEFRVSTCPPAASPSSLLSASGSPLAALPTSPSPHNSNSTNSTMYQQSQLHPQQQHHQHQIVDPSQLRKKALVRIVEQPASKALRFRYECEGRSAGSIPGASSIPENKTFPSIQVMGYQGKAVVVVSCVTKDPPYRPHPHNLVGREGCKKGVCTLEIPPETMSITFQNLGIQCVKKKDIESALRMREEIRVDPFKTGFDHRSQPTSIDLNAVRLCFQVFLESAPGKVTIPVQPVVSDIIYDKKAMCDLVITKLSDCVASVDGSRKELILLCEKVAKEDIQIRFYEEKNDILVWEDFADFQPSQVHKQTAICFRTPRYKNLEIIEPVKVNIQLRRPSDGATSEPLPFELLPKDSGSKRKRKFEHPSSSLRPLTERDQDNQLHRVDIKAEPLDPNLSPIYQAGGISPYGPSLSPGHPHHIYMPNIGNHPCMNLKASPSSPQQQQALSTCPQTQVDPTGADMTGGVVVQHCQQSPVGGLYCPTPGPTLNNLGSLPTETQQNVCTLPPIAVLPRPMPTTGTNANWNIVSNQNELGVMQCVQQSQAQQQQANEFMSLTDLDSNEPMRLVNSSEIRNYFDNLENLSENLSNNLMIAENSTDSLTRLERAAYDRMYPPNDMAGVTPNCQ